MSLEVNAQNPHNSPPPPPPALLQPDTLSAAVVRSTELYTAWAVMALAALCLVPVLTNFFIPLFKQGIADALINSVVALLVMVFVFSVCHALLQRLLIAPWRSLRYRACTKRMVAELPSLNLRPTALHQWHSPNPGVLALDAQNHVLYINARSGGYERLLLTRQDILGVKVERESEVHTKTTHGGSLSVFSSAGFGYTFGSRSKSTSVVVERAFLEIHYQRPGDAVPTWVALPFGENRREADSFAVAIQRL